MHLCASNREPVNILRAPVSDCVHTFMYIMSVSFLILWDFITKDLMCKALLPGLVSLQGFV